MEGNFRLVLIIISAVVIAAIFLHGFWTIRKQKNPYKLKAPKGLSDSASEFSGEERARGFDGSGFDQDGVSKVRVVSANTHTDMSGNEADFPQNHDNENADEIDDLAQYNAETLDHYLNDQNFEEQLVSDDPNVTSTPTDLKSNEDSNSVNDGDHDETNSLTAPFDKFDEPSHNETLTSTENNNTETPEQNSTQTSESVTTEEEPVHSTPIYQEPVTNAKPKVSPRIEPKMSVKPERKNVVRKKPVNQAKKNQLEINFENDHDFSADEIPSMSATEQKSEPKIEKPQLDPEVLIVSVVMPEGELMSGAALLPMLLTLGMKFGDMDIFHRHQDNAGNGKVTFSLVNMMNPGTFNLDEMESISTQGVSLFMTLPNAGDAFEVFEQMFSAAKQIAVEFNGQVLDDKRSVMTKQTVQHYTGKIRDFERKSRISA